MPPQLQQLPLSPPTTKIITKSQTQTQTHNLITIHHQQPKKEKEKQPSKITTKSQTHNLITTNNQKRKKKKKNNHRERPTRSKTHANLPSTPMPTPVRDPWTHSGQIQNAKFITHTTTAETEREAETTSRGREREKEQRNGCISFYGWSVGYLWLLEQEWETE